MPRAREPKPDRLLRTLGGEAMDKTFPAETRGKAARLAQEVVGRNLNRKLPGELSHGLRQAMDLIAAELLLTGSGNPLPARARYFMLAEG